MFEWYDVKLIEVINVEVFLDDINIICFKNVVYVFSVLSCVLGVVLELFFLYVKRNVICWLL